MAFNTTAGMTFKTPAGTISSVLAEYSTDALVEYDFVVPASTTNQLCNAAFTYAGIKNCCLVSTGACTVKTNSSSAPDDTISLTSTILAKQYTHDGKAGNVASNPFTADVTKMYITNAGGSSITVKVRVAYDATP